MPDDQSEEILAQEKPKKLTVWQVMTSVSAAALGVQSEKNRTRDFSHGKPSTFIIAGLIFTGLFVLTVVGIVKLVVTFAVN